jgi:hypothetical protein
MIRAELRLAFFYARCQLRCPPPVPCTADKLRVSFRANSSERIVKLNRPRSWFRPDPLLARTDSSSCTRRLTSCVTKLK